jgi:hypothetical protein
MGKVIKFSNTNGWKDLEQPQLASAFIPDWYKNVESYIGGKKVTDGKGGTMATIKRCMPVFDAITSGYIITSPADVMVTLKDGQQYFEWANFGLITFHPIEQAPEHPARKPHQYPKWNNPWAIKTPKGYSTMFVQPMHRESVFTILPGIVDTDMYTAPVNFPFVINDSNFEGLIPKGTPIAQVIPIKRDAWKMEFGGQEELIEQANITTKLQTKFFDRYKTMFWSRKEYK